MGAKAITNAITNLITNLITFTPRAVRLLAQAFEDKESNY